MQPTTQLERQETLLMLASLQAGQRVMDPEPRHLEAIFELLEEEPRMAYPQEHHVTPTEDHERAKRQREMRYQIRRRAIEQYQRPQCEGRPLDGPRALVMACAFLLSVILGIAVFGAIPVLSFIGGLGVATGALLLIARWN